MPIGGLLAASQLSFWLGESYRLLFRGAISPVKVQLIAILWALLKSDETCDH